MTEAERDATRDAYEATWRTTTTLHERDRDVPLRVLVLAERLPLASTSAFRMVSALTTMTEELRVTVGVAEAAAADIEALERTGVEVVVDPSSAWLGGRPMHATVAVVVGAAAAMRFGEAVLASQPQAALVYDPSGEAPPDHVAGRAGEAPLLVAAHVVLAPSQAHARFARELSATAQIVPAAPGTPDLDRAFVHALALSGVALPDVALG